MRITSNKNTKRERKTGTQADLRQQRSATASLDRATDQLDQQLGGNWNWVMRSAACCTCRCGTCTCYTEDSCKQHELQGQARFAALG